MNIIELLKAVREANLNKLQLEDYHLKLTGIYGDAMLETADLEKQKANFFYERTNGETPDIKIKRAWDASAEGQRLIYLKALVKTIAKQLQSLKSRLYSTY